jgi:hypothetical protein
VALNVPVAAPGVPDTTSGKAWTSVIVQHGAKLLMYMTDSDGCHECGRDITWVKLRVADWDVGRLYGIEASDDAAPGLVVTRSLTMAAAGLWIDASGPSEGVRVGAVAVDETGACTDKYIPTLGLGAGSVGGAGADAMVDGWTQVVWAGNSPEVGSTVCLILEIGNGVKVFGLGIGAKSPER